MEAISWYAENIIDRVFQWSGLLAETKKIKRADIQISYIYIYTYMYIYIYKGGGG